MLALKKKNNSKKKILFYKNLKFSEFDINNKINTINKLINLNRAVVFLFCENSHNFIFFYLSLMSSNAVIFLLDKNINQKKFDEITKEFKPNFIIKPKDSNIKINLNKFMKNIYNYKIYLFSHKKIHINPELKLLLLTSGSTGPSKFVMLSKQNLVTNIKQICDYLKINRSDKVIINLPLNYSYGLSIFNTHFLKRGKIILSENSVIEKKFWDLFKKFKITCIYGVPQTYEILKRIKFINKNLNYLKFMAVAGGKINNKALEYMCFLAKKNSFNFFNMYGQTEASPRIAYSSLKNRYQNISTIGRPVKGGRLFIKDNKGKVINKKNKEGLLYYYGKNVMIGYAKNKDDLAKTRSNKFIINTNDIAKKDCNNNFEITGRFDKFVKINSQKINLSDLENFVSSFSKSNACIAKNNRILVFVESLKIEKSDLKKKLSNFSSLNQNLILINNLKKIPKTYNNKVNYFKLKSLKI